MLPTWFVLYTNVAVAPVERLPNWLSAGPDCTKAVGADSATALPTEFLAVTWKRNFTPTSAATGRYVRLVAPGMETHFVPVEVQRVHCNESAVAGAPLLPP